MKHRTRNKLSGPDHSIRLFEQAIACQRAGQPKEAEALYRKLLRKIPLHADAWGNLGTALKSQGALEEAEACLRKAMALDPGNANHPYNLGNTLRELHRLDEAINAYHQAIALRPAFAGAHYNLGLSLDEQGQTEEAMAVYRTALAAEPGHYDSNLNLGVLLEAEGVLSEAIRHYRCAITVAPEKAAAYNNLGLALQNAGRPEEAIAVEQQALDKEPEQHRIASNMLMTLQYLPGVMDQDLFAAARQFGGRFPAPSFMQAISATDRPLRIGYVSADLYSHPVGLFLRDVIPFHDQSAFQVYCYSNSSRSDEVTAGIAEHVTWRWIKGAGDEELLAQIKADAIDILVDLSGHTAGNRLPVFARRAAPVQIAWLGYFATTGVPAMDFVILDHWHAPEGTEVQFTERIIRLPHNRFCYSPANFAPDVAPPPFEKNGFVTFGSFNNTAKLNITVLETWARILDSVAGSRLILKWRTLADGAYCGELCQFFSQRGIPDDRLEFRTVSLHGSLLQQYADIDIALDPFPFSGGHTSCEALWMGVPVVTLPQGRVVSRQTWSFLNNIGLPGLAAADTAAYIQLAASLAASPATLRELRSTLRERLRQSPLCDSSNFVKYLESAYTLAFNTIISEQADALHQKGLILLQEGNIVESRFLLEQTIALNPTVAAYHANLGVALKLLNAPPAARISCYRQAITLDSLSPLYHANLAGALNEELCHTEAEAAANRALALDASCKEAWFNLGNCLMHQERWQEAAEAFDRAAACQPGWIEALISSANCYRALPRWSAAGDRYLCALNSLPPDGNKEQRSNLLANLGWVCVNLYAYANAEPYYRQALELNPDDISLLTDLGNVLKASNRMDEARQCYLKVIKESPDMGAAWCNLGTVEQGAGNYEQAIDCYRKAVALQPDLGSAWSNLTNCLTYSPNHSPEEVLATYQAFDEQIARPLRSNHPHSNDRATDRRLRIGYLSPDFRRHAVAYFALPLLEGHHTEQFELFCYYNHRQQDGWTERFKVAAAHWLDCVGLDDAALAQRIRDDRIDILVDLAGHTENNRLLTFARKPAPVQVTWMGYVTTTGMNAMDWRITHADADPEGMEAFYSEKLWRLSGTMWCYRPLPDMPEVAPSPFLSKGYVTFGSFNRYSKNSPLVLQTWATILQQVPDSRLLICVPEGSIRDEMFTLFAEQGVGRERVACFAKVSHPEFWNLHAEVDIALDPFPFGGGTTTCETLWLGVPLITCTGSEDGDFAPRFASRMGYAFLNSLGLSELAATTVEDYIRLAVSLAHNGERLSALRSSLRPRMATAPLTDEKRFVREMEDAYHAMWREWCAQSSGRRHLPEN